MVKEKAKLSHFEDYLLGLNCSKPTIESYGRTVQQFLQIIDKKPGEDITMDDPGKFKIWTIKIKKYDSNTLIPKYAAINKYMEYLKKPKEWRDTNKLMSPQKVIKNKDTLTRKEIQKLFKASEDNPRDNALLKTAYYTLLRRNEIINLNVDDIKPDDLKVFKNNGKGKNYASINIHPDAVDAISAYLPFREPKRPVQIKTDRKETKKRKEQREQEELKRRDAEKALFLSKDGYRISKSAIHYTIKKYAVHAGIKKRVFPHLFRISGITHMAERGLNVAEIMRQSTHKDPKVLIGYIQLADQHVKEAYLRGLSLDETEQRSEPNQKASKQSFQPKPSITHRKTEPKVVDTSDLELKLIEKLADGEISNDVYSHAILRLKERNRTEGLQGYM